MALGRRRVLVNAGSEEEFTASRLATQARIARELRAPLIVHIGELRGSVETLALRFQKPVLQLLHSHNIMRASTVFVHLNHCSEEDVAIVEKVGCTLTLCARGAARKKCGFPLIRHLSGHGLKLCVGTDSVDADVLAELRFLRELPLLFADVPEFSSLDLLRMATINGAHALHLHEKTGSIERGKRADLVFFSLSDVRIPPLADNPSARQLADLLVDDLSVCQISEVMSGGRFAVVDGKLTMQNEAEITRGLRSTLAHWSSPASPNPMVQPQERARVPYVDVRDVAGWWNGYPTGGLSSLPRAPVIPPAQSQIPGTGLSPTSVPTANLPELTADVRRVFGEDDEF
jgi:5-methylthioadenosine/S-adenosylhomocysteine deaminase